MYTLIATAKLNGIDPQVWPADVLRRIADHPASRVHELLPWHWKQPADQAVAALNIVNRKPQVELLLQVEPPRGSRSFEPNALVEVSEFAAEKLAAIGVSQIAVAQGLFSAILPQFAVELVGRGCRAARHAG